MSLVFSTVDVPAGPTVGLKEQVKLPVFPSEDKTNSDTGFPFGAADEKDDASSDTSSIGAHSSSVSSEDRGSDDQDEAESKSKDGSLGSFSSLEESLPIKRGLSSYFSGKSKSFASLSECANADAGDIAKPENPFNKRRRILAACKTSWSRRASCSSLVSTLPPLRSPDVTVEEGDEEGEERGGGDPDPSPHGAGNLYKGLAPPRSFSLFDLGHV